MTAQKQVEESTGEAMTLNLSDLGSIGIMKVLETVTEQGSINISHLSRKTGLNHSSCDAHVKKLVSIGLLEERRYGNLRMIKPTFDSLAVVFKKGFGLTPHTLFFTSRLVLVCELNG
jgi:predicted transcriptional regulator